MPPWRELGGHVRCPCAAASRTRAKRSTRTRTCARITLWWGGGLGKSEPRTAPRKEQKVRDVFAGRALKSHSSRRIEEGHDVLNTCVSRSSSRSWRCYARPRPSWRRLRALPPPPPRVGPRRGPRTHLTLYAFSYPPCGSPTSSPLIVVNCVWSAYMRLVLPDVRHGHTKRARAKTTQEGNGGSCSGTASKTQDCNAQACNPILPRRLLAPRLPQGHHQAHDESHRHGLGHRRRVQGQGQDRHRRGRRHLRGRRLIDAIRQILHGPAVVGAAVRYPVDATAASKPRFWGGRRAHDQGDVHAELGPPGAGARR